VLSGVVFCLDFDPFFFLLFVHLPGVSPLFFICLEGVKQQTSCHAENLKEIFNHGTFII
jgi:hypothetical protein